MIRTAGGVVSEKRFGGQGGSLTSVQWFWHFYNQLRDSEELNEGLSAGGGDGASTGGGPIVENAGYAAELIEQGMKPETVAKILKISVEELKRKLNESIPDMIKVDG